MNQLLPFEGCECYAGRPPLRNPLFYNHFGTEVLLVEVDEDFPNGNLLVALTDIPFLRGATRVQQTTVQLGTDFRDEWLRWPLLNQQLSLEELRAADKAYRATLVWSAKRWREMAKLLANDPRWNWYFLL